MGWKGKTERDVCDCGRAGGRVRGGAQGASTVTAVESCPETVADPRQGQPHRLWVGPCSREDNWSSAGNIWPSRAACCCSSCGTGARDQRHIKATVPHPFPLALHLFLLLLSLCLPWLWYFLPQLSSSLYKCLFKWQLLPTPPSLPQPYSHAPRQLLM